MASRFFEAIRIRSKETDHEEARGGEIIKASPDLLPVLPLPDGPRRWGAFHLSGYWIAEAFGLSFVPNNVRKSNTQVCAM